MLSSLLVILAFLAAWSAASDPLTDVVAAVSRASTPWRARPLNGNIPGVDLVSMWAQANATDMEHNSTDCRAFMLQYEFSLRLVPERAPLTMVFDALRLGTDCGVTEPSVVDAAKERISLPASSSSSPCTIGPFYADASVGSDSNDGSLGAPFQSIPRALAATRTGGPRAPGGGTQACIILRGSGGVPFYLQSTVLLAAGDSGLSISAYAGETPWISGGAPLGSLSWSPYNTTAGQNVWVASIPPAASTPFNVTSMMGLNTLSLQAGAVPTRLWRARYPSGYDQEQFSGPLPDMRQVVEWVKPPVMAIPTLFFRDLQALGLKNDSTMSAYNQYATGRGGPCSHWANDGDTYVCSNITAGGWEFVESGLAMTGRLGFPIAMVYNATQLPSFAAWTMPAPSGGPYDWTNAPTLTAWHNQGWFQAAYALTGINRANNTLSLSVDGIMPSGGWQGGRVMENIDPYNFSTPMGSGPWYISNVFEELNEPGEYYFDPTERKLYVFYNASSGTPPPADWPLVVSQLEVFFNLSGTPAAPVSDVTFEGLSFRDQRTAQLDPWVDPSGGDWGLRRAGALHLEGTHRTTVSGCTFYRTDANAVFIAAYNRNATVQDCEFAYIGFSAVATFGTTIQDDGTNGEQPWGTVIAYNVVHELGTYQLQSSAWFTAKATLTRAEGNVIFNIPRAGININDGFGGGNNISRCSIFNTCRQSGDHGPINTWDRMPQSTRIRSLGGEASYSGADTETSRSMIIANYGASQGQDDDDGSSFYDIHDNFFYNAAGFKDDYGGHDSRFHSNVVVATNGQNCLGTASFVTNHSDMIYDNDCIVYGTERVDDLFENCNTPSPGQEMIRGFNNRFYTPQANASATCDIWNGKARPLAQLPAGLEANFTSSYLPSGDTIIAWGRAKLQLDPLP